MCWGIMSSTRSSWARKSLTGGGSGGDKADSAPTSPAADGGPTKVPQVVPGGGGEEEGRRGTLSRKDSSKWMDNPVTASHGDAEYVLCGALDSAQRACRKPPFPRALLWAFVLVGAVYGLDSHVFVVPRAFPCCLGLWGWRPAATSTALHFDGCAQGRQAPVRQLRVQPAHGVHQYLCSCECLVACAVFPSARPLAPPGPLQRFRLATRGYFALPSLPPFSQSSQEPHSRIRRTKIRQYSPGWPHSRGGHAVKPVGRGPWRTVSFCRQGQPQGQCRSVRGLQGSAYAQGIHVC